MRRALVSRAALIALVLSGVPSVALAQPRPAAPPEPPKDAPPPPSKDAPPPGDDEPKGDDEPEPPKGPNGRPKIRGRGEPTALAPTDPLAVPSDVQKRIGSDTDAIPASPEGNLEHRKWFPYYEERKGDYRFRMLPPLFFEHTRGLPDPNSKGRYGIPEREDTEGLYGLLYYRRRSLKLDADVLFPLAWRVRDRENKVLVLGPLVHREAPDEHDNWLAPIVFQGSRKDGGYFHSPLLLTTSHWGAEGAFTLAGPYFRDRTGTDVDMGVAPLFFHGDNGNIDGARKTYTLIPPLLFYRSTNELEGSSTTIVGPVISKSNPKRDIFDVAPLFVHIKGKPESGGIREEHTTLFPLFHYGHTPDESLFIVPGYLRRKTPTVDTMLTPFYSHSETRNGSTSLTAIGPILPLYMSYADKDIGLSSFGIFPFYFQSTSPAGRDFLTPLFGKFETYGVSRTYWAFPTITVTRDQTGWSSNLHPLVYVGRNGDSSHTVVAPFFWDFAGPKSRTTVGFPLYWRFAEEDNVTQVAANTLYIQKRVAGGIDWQFHLLPLFSYGENPQGYFWNLLFGLAGYERAGSYARVKAFWVPIQVAGPSATQTEPR